MQTYLNDIFHATFTNIAFQKHINASIMSHGYNHINCLSCHMTFFSNTAHCGSGLVCNSVTYLEYKSPCLAIYATPQSHIGDIRELAMEFFGVHMT